MYSYSEVVSGRENGVLESVFVDMTLCVGINIFHGATMIIEGDDQKRTVVSRLRLLTTLGGRGVEVAPVGTKLENKVEKNEAGQEDLERGPGLGRYQGILREPTLGYSELLIHVLGKLEVEKCDFVCGEVAGQFD